MRRLTVTTTAILLAALLTPPALRAQGRKIDKRPPQTRTNSDRWQRLDPAKRSEIEKIYQQLRSLPAEKQKQLLDKLHRMQPEERRAAVSVSPSHSVQARTGATRDAVTGSGSLKWRQGRIRTVASAIGLKPVLAGKSVRISG